MAVLVPEWVGRDIGNDNSFSPVSGGSARTGTRTNQCAVNRLRVTFGKAGCCAVPQTFPIGAYEKDRNQNVAGHLFAKSAQSIQNRFERTAFGDHFQNPLLSGEQRVSLLQFSHTLAALSEFAPVTL